MFCLCLGQKTILMFGLSALDRNPLFLCFEYVWDRKHFLCLARVPGTQTFIDWPMSETENTHKFMFGHLCLANVFWTETIILYVSAMSWTENTHYLCLACVLGTKDTYYLCLAFILVRKHTLLLLGLYAQTQPTHITYVWPVYNVKNTLFSFGLCAWHTKHTLHVHGFGLGLSISIDLLSNH